MIYLLHFERPLRGGAQHYVGTTSRPVEARLAEHRAGRGARLTKRAAKEGVGMVVAGTWPGSRALELRMSRGGHLRALCSICSGCERGG